MLRTASTAPAKDATYLLRLLACSGDPSGGSSNWLEAAGGAGASKQQTKDHEEFNTVVAGEPVTVRVSFRNPLSVKLRLSALRLTCEFTPSTVSGWEAAAAAPAAWLAGAVPTTNVHTHILDMFGST